MAQNQLVMTKKEKQIEKMLNSLSIRTKNKIEKVAKNSKTIGNRVEVPKPYDFIILDIKGNVRDYLIKLEYYRKNTDLETQIFNN